MDASWLYTICSFFLLLLAFNFATSRKLKLPPSPVLRLPFFGHLYLLKAPIHRTYLQLSEKLGPIFSLHLGNRLIVVVSSPSLFEECFTKNDVVLANRTHFIVSKYIGYNYTTLLDAPYGDHWRNLRRLFMVEVLSTTRLNMFQQTRQDEVKLMLERLYNSSKHDLARVELKKVFMDLNLNIIMRMVSGKRYYDVRDSNEEAKQFQDNMEDLNKALGGTTNPADFFPLLRWIFRGHEKYVERISEKLDAFFQNMVDECRRNRNNSMIDHLLYLQESDPEYYSDTIIKGIITVRFTSNIY